MTKKSQSFLISCSLPLTHSYLDPLNCQGIRFIVVVVAAALRPNISQEALNAADFLFAGEQFLSRGFGVGPNVGSSR